MGAGGGWRGIRWKRLTLTPLGEGRVGVVSFFRKARQARPTFAGACGDAGVPLWCRRPVANLPLHHAYAYAAMRVRHVCARARSMFPHGRGLGAHADVVCALSPLLPPPLPPPPPPSPTAAPFGWIGRTPVCTLQTHSTLSLQASGMAAAPGTPPAGHPVFSSHRPSLPQRLIHGFEAWVIAPWWAAYAECETEQLVARALRSAVVVTPSVPVLPPPSLPAGSWEAVPAATARVLDLRRSSGGGSATPVALGPHFDDGSGDDGSGSDDGSDGDSDGDGGDGEAAGRRGLLGGVGLGHRGGGGGGGGAGLLAPGPSPLGTRCVRMCTLWLRAVAWTATAAAVGAAVGVVDAGLGRKFTRLRAPPPLTLPLSLSPSLPLSLQPCPSTGAAPAAAKRHGAEGRQ
jgi:hypothetical protein